MWGRHLIAVLLVGVTATSLANAAPADDSTPALVRTAAQCAALASLDLTRVQDAPTQITGTTLVQAEGKDPAYCRVEGYVAPQVGFELRLPVSTWNHKFILVGSGGLGGSMLLYLCNGPMRRGYACIATDMGHKDKSDHGLWASGNLQAQLDYGFRATHVTALAGKAIIEKFYATAPAQSLMFGCSTGGYQSLVEAQRFPWDFDGIVSVSPDSTSEADLAMRHLWRQRYLFDRNGEPTFSEKALELLHNAALAKCDMSDGVKDGIVGDPVHCAVDPAAWACKAGQTADCLSPQQVDAARKIYSGPMTSSGVRISTSGEFPGSELEWNNKNGGHAPELFKFALFMPTPGPDWKATDFDFDRDYKRLGIGALYEDNNPDLRKFKGAGGKLIMVQGAVDSDETPGAVVDYYETVERTMGGAAATEDFFRFFIVPGMQHCSGGEGAVAIDYLSYMEDWVERGQAPGKMIGAHVNTDYLEKISGVDPEEPDTWVRNGRAWTGAFLKLLFPLDPSVPVEFTRPVYPYPLHAKYKGSGNPNEAASFVPAGPTR
jgi:hypothetical protein